MLLIDGTFVAVFPKLVRALGGDMQAAAVLQSIHYRTPSAGAWTDLSLADIADETGLSTDQVHRSTARLRAAGLLQADGGRGAARQWRIDYDQVDALPIDGPRPSTPARKEDSTSESVAIPRRSPPPKRPRKISTGVAESRRPKEPPLSTTVAESRRNRRGIATPLLIEVKKEPPLPPFGVEPTDSSTMPKPWPHCDHHRRHRTTCPACAAQLADAVLAAQPPPWCGHCDPAGEHNPGQRFIDAPRARGRPAVAPCPRCHPSTTRRVP